MKTIGKYLLGVMVVFLLGCVFAINLPKALDQYEYENYERPVEIMKEIESQYPQK